MLDAWEEYLQPFGVDRRACYSALRRLVDSPSTISSIVESTGLSRRSVEQLIRKLDSSVSINSQNEYFIGEGVGKDKIVSILDAYARRAADVEHRANDPATLLQIRKWIRHVPAPKKNLDHVQATPETVLRRAAWLATEFTLDGRHLAFVGDHDLTSLAVRLVEPACAISVVDIDEELLEYVHVSQSPLKGAEFQIRYTDLRSSFPADLLRRSDVFVTDPPYTPDGVRLFVSRGIQSLRSASGGRGMIAYGFGEQMQSLGLKVQKSIIDLDLVFDQVLKSFNSYAGAQAIGSRSDWYVLRTTPGSLKRSSRVTGQSERAIYTHGSASIESSLDPIELDAIYRKLNIRQGPRLEPDGAVVSSRESHQGFSFTDLRGMSDSSVFRRMLDLDVSNLVLLVDNSHPSLQSKTAQDQASSDIAPKYSLKFYRSFPSNKSAVIHASAISDEVGSSRWGLLTRSTETLGSRLRESHGQPDMEGSSRAWEYLQQEQLVDVRVCDCPISLLRVIKSLLAM